jgi:O-antigen/teichoic acid export membrane protein
VTLAFARRRSLTLRSFRWRQALRLSGWALLDQALISITSFVTLVMLARNLSQSAFGGFSLVYFALLFFNGLQTALVTQAHNVLGTTRKGSEYRRYSTSTALGQLLLTSVVCVLVLLTALITHAAGSSLATLVVALAPALAMWHAQEFFRRVLYTEARYLAALANDVVSYGGQVLLLLAVWASGALTGPAALSTIAVSSAVAAVVGFFQTRGSFARSIETSFLRENWNYGKWLGAGHMAYWLAAQLPAYTAAVVIGQAAAGVLKASQMLLAPLNILIIFLSTVLPTQIARRVAAGGSVRRLLSFVWISTAPVVVVYAGGVALAAAPLLRHVYGPAYADAVGVVRWSAGYFFLVYLWATVIAAAYALALTRTVFRAVAAAAVATSVASLLLIAPIGTEGAVIAMILGAAVGAAMLGSALLLRPHRSKDVVVETGR